MSPLAFHPDARLIESTVGRHLFVVDGSRLYDLPEALWEELRAEDAGGRRDKLDSLLAELAAPGGPYIGPEPPEPLPLAAISLNVAQSCNMGCAYCYADEGRFGGRARAMRPETARGVIDRLIAEASPGSRIVVGFMGGEPLLAREVVHESTAHAAAAAAAAGLDVGFSITTNLTLLTEDDAALFRDHGFSVAVSLDGPPEVNDRLRPMRGKSGGGGSYARVLRSLELIEAVGRPRALTARATVTPGSHDLLAILEHLIGLGFDEVGFAPVMRAPAARLEHGTADFRRHLGEMIRCGDRAQAALLAGEAFPFSNFLTALREIHRGTHRPYPCGAGAGYLSANAEGRLYACHRLVDDEDFAMGGLDGSDLAARRAHLAERHVDRQEPCRSCWARYLCGGGCHHEVKARGRPACDYIRGWLEYCLAAYTELSARAPRVPDCL